MALLTFRGALWLLAVIAAALVLVGLLSIIALSVWYQRYWPRGRE